MEFLEEYGVIAPPKFNIAIWHPSSTFESWFSYSTSKFYIRHWSFEFDIEVENSVFHIQLSSFKFNLQLLNWTSRMNDLTFNFVSLVTVTTDVVDWGLARLAAEILRRLAEVVQETLTVLSLLSLQIWLSSSKTRLCGSNTSENR